MRRVFYGLAWMIEPSIPLLNLFFPNWTFITLLFILLYPIHAKAIDSIAWWWLVQHLLGICTPAFWFFFHSLCQSLWHASVCFIRCSGSCSCALCTMRPFRGARLTSRFFYRAAKWYDISSLHTCVRWPAGKVHLVGPLGNVWRFWRAATNMEMRWCIEM